MEPKVGEIYQHFKGRDRLYRIIAIARDCENKDKKIVVYEQLYVSEFPKGTLWIRALDDFIGEKVFDKDVEYDGRKFGVGERVKKFVLVS